MEVPIGPIFDTPGELDPSESGAWTQFNNVLSIAIGILTAIAGIWFVFLIITGAISYMTAGGDQGKIEDARKRITTGLIGLVIVIGAIFIADFVGYLLGFDILNPGNFLYGLGDAL